MMKTIFGKSWKTSAAAYATIAGYAALTAISGGTFALKDIALAVGIAVFGRFAKDHNVTGLPE